jgi:mRNA-degrading endonuclease RelE of RelBE toxin-antitoxin system
MFQIIFNEISAAELSSLPKDLQFEVLEQFQILPEDLEAPSCEKFGVIERDGKKLYRYYAKNNYRIYFEKTGDGIIVHRILHKSTFRDFLFRSQLPMAEDEQLGQSKAFWKLIKEGEEASRK